MEKRNSVEASECRDPKCDYHFPLMRPHKHVHTQYGTYIKYIIDKPKKKVHNSSYDDQYMEDF